MPTTSIWKFPLPDLAAELTVRMIRGAELLSVASQDGIPCIWARVDTESPTADRRISVRGTGHPEVPPAASFLGTVIGEAHLSGLVFHFFDGGEVDPEPLR